MDEQLSKSAPEQTMPPSDPVMSQDPNLPDEPSKPKKGKKKLILIIAIILVILASGLYALVLKKDKAIAPSPQLPPAVETTPPAEDNHLYFHLGTKLLSYDPVAKKSETLSNKIPKAAQVLDFFSDGSTWRAYIAEQADMDYKLYYIEKDKALETIYSSKEFVMAAANAKAKTVAYTEVFNVDPAGPSAKKKSQHYVLKGSQKTLLLESVENGKDVPVTDPKNTLYSVGDISPDGSKVLLQLHTCFYCDGPAIATAVEIDVASKATKLVHQNNNSGSIKFLPNNAYLIELSHQGGLGDPSDVPLELKLQRLDMAGAKASEILTVNEANWAFVRYSPAATYLAPEIKLQNFAENGLSRFGGILERKDEAVKSAKSLTVSGLDGKNHYVLQISEPRGGCFGLVLTNREETSTKVKFEAGLVCKSGTTYAYTMVDKLEYGTSETGQNAAVF